MSIRCFIAIELDPAVRRGLRRLGRRLLSQFPGSESAIKWVQPDNIHLTLSFLGDVGDRIIPDICTAASAAAQAHSPFDIEIADCGSFPPARPARVLWVGVTTGAEPLAALQQSLQDRLAEVGFAPENRKFTAHLTLARVKNAQAGRQVLDMLKDIAPINIGSQAVTELTVFQSQLLRAGPLYTALHQAPLGK